MSRAAQTTVEHVHFTITGEFVTNMSRTLWADEEQPEKALNLLRAAFPGMKEADRLCIVTGSKKVTGDSNAGCELEDDNATESPAGNPLATAIDRMMASIRKKEEERMDLRALVTGDTVNMGSPQGLIEVPRHRTERRGVMNRAVLKEGVELENIIYRGLSNEDGDFLGEPIRRPTARELDEEARSENPDEPLPVPLDTIPKDATDGWLSPEGKFYQCGWREHISLAGDLGKTQVMLEQQGWIKLSANQIFEPYRPPVTQAQLTRVYDWCVANEKELPWWAKEEEYVPKS